MIVVADTSGIIAAADRRAPESVRVSSLVLAEVDHLAKVRFGTQARHVILGNIITQALEPFFSVAGHECAKRGPAEWVQAVGFKSGPRVPAAAVPLPGVAVRASADTCRPGLACGTCRRWMESCWSNGEAACRCRHGHTSAAGPDPGRLKNAYIREGRAGAPRPPWTYCCLSGTTARAPATDPARRRRPPGPHSTRRGQVRPRERGRRRLRPDDRNLES